jgi:hypothetical protein
MFRFQYQKFAIKAEISTFSKIFSSIKVKGLFTVHCTVVKTFKQGCGSVSGLDPDLVTLWIRIRIGNPNPGSRGKKIKKYQWKNAHFSFFFKVLPLKKV